MRTRTSAASQQLACCHICLKLAPQDVQDCPRCGSPTHLRKPNSLQRTLALLVTATLLYIPANIFPIMITDQLGTALPSTILGGVILLIELGSAPIAAVIFIASVMIPSGKLMAMYYLCWCAHKGNVKRTKSKSVLYRATEFIGKWSMVDVFVVAILVALVSLGGLLSIQPGIAATAFAAVVIITMVAAESFDPRLLWDEMENTDD
ncbi:paraquat-inducible protein A [Aestuariirhabdus sp. Z084]|uniref:paraquat-inducible protein A n=1 Tax=Aestuariirhabdus haliotis TaxID=2918751 RepID=UPI00201B400C|nr:paraquat-inducible protein A [Aestuariirhabdus haliotis]MCL6415351.1 paraquat-inducible protein A [Aestuariirhabdus haliotis]MCL6419107.1 paraquat-inducible protein A [Aestuariirhabdus haliotis]